jgi:uncharacterized integral membrane protein
VSTPPNPETPGGKSPWTVRRIVLGVIVLYVLIVVIANRRSTPVNFVFFKTEASLFVILLLALALGFVAGWLFDDLRERRRRSKEKD